MGQEIENYFMPKDIVNFFSILVFCNAYIFYSIVTVPAFKIPLIYLFIYYANDGNSTKSLKQNC